ncbi:MAG: hypothetical protein WDO15_06260 [Bacteroidota bacterium]
MFENNLSTYNRDEDPDYHYPFNPNLPGFRKKILSLTHENQSKEEIINMITTSTMGADYPNAQSFKDLYLMPAIKDKKNAFIFLRLEKGRLL